MSLWRPVTPSGYVFGGHVAVVGLETPTFATPIFLYDASLMAHPTGLEEMWNDRGSGSEVDVAVWNMVPPYGFTCVGNIAIGAYTPEPPRNTAVCLNSHLLIQDATPFYIWDDQLSGMFLLWQTLTDPVTTFLTGADWDGSFWGSTAESVSAGLDLRTFYTRRNHDGPGYNKQFWLDKNAVIIE